MCLLPPILPVFIFIIFHRSGYISIGDDNILNNNYACVLTDSTHIFTCRSLLFDLATGNSRKIPVPINGTMCMGLDSSGNIWNSTEGNVISFNLHNPKKVNRYPVAADNFLRTFFLARNGRFWISTRKFLGYEFNKELTEYIPYKANYDSIFFLLLNRNSRRAIGWRKQ